jgi:hypothetical protein
LAVAVLKVVVFIMHFGGAMKKFIVAVTLLLIAGQAWGELLCTPEEKSMFSCKLGNSSKSVSVCQSKSNPKMISYKFGTPQKIEITLPAEKSGKPYLVFERFGSGGTQWIKSINFPSGKVVYSLSTPQGISVQLLVEGIKKPISMSCETGDSGSELSDAYDEMEKLKFKTM